MLYLVFSFDENGCEEYWSCFTDQDDAERYMLTSYYDACDMITEEFDAHINSDHKYAIIEIHNGKGSMLEFFVVEIPESKILPTMAN